MNMLRLLLLLIQYYVSAAVASDIPIPTADLVRHFLFLRDEQERTTPLEDSRINFELGLSSSLLLPRLDELATSPIAGAKDILILGESGLQAQAEESYRACLEGNPVHVDALSNFALLLSENNNDWNDQDATDDIIELYERALSTDPLHFRTNMNYAAFLRDKLGRHQAALEIYNHGLMNYPDSPAMRFELAFTLELQGEYDKAITLYQDVIGEDPTYTFAIWNLASIHQKQFNANKAIELYSRALSTVKSYGRDCFRKQLQSGEDPFIHIQSPFNGYGSLHHNHNTTCTCPSNGNIKTVSKILNNNGLVFYQLGKYTEAIVCFIEIITLHRICDPTESEIFLVASANLFRSSKAGCFFSAWNWLEELLSSVDLFLQLEDGRIPPILPFDTLSLPVSRGWKRRIAEIYARNAVENKLVAQRYEQDDQEQRIVSKQKLRLAFLSHDFSNHPTTYLFEGITKANHTASNIEIAAYSYSRDDNSPERRSIIDALGHSFLDLFSMSNEDATLAICNDKSDIIFDMQAFTLGARDGLMANSCAGIKVNYLAYPGTTGARYFDYVIADKYVSSIERADEQFSEQLAILPRSYQANYFVDPIHIPTRGSSEWKELRAQGGLSTSTTTIVFANLNKHDKMDPQSFATMMQCLARVPDSVLWLLEPSQPEAASIVKRNLRNSAEKAGISPKRLIFAKKVSRKEHIRRMAVGDLFLDTQLYGAHTTATDALRGGMPLLTLAGDTFSSRVGMSLLHGMNKEKASSLIVYSELEFINTAIEIATAQIEHASSGVKSIGTRFIDSDEESDDSDFHELFDWKSYSRDLDDLSKMMMEVKHLTPRKMHVVLS